jgi:hypothetical protein
LRLRPVDHAFLIRFINRDDGNNIRGGDELIYRAVNTRGRKREWHERDKESDDDRSAFHIPINAKVSFADYREISISLQLAIGRAIGKWDDKLLPENLVIWKSNQRRVKSLLDTLAISLECAGHFF